MKFLGIDLGWMSAFVEPRSATSNSGYLELDRQLGIRAESAMIAVDVPTLIPNLTGCAYPIALLSSISVAIMPIVSQRISDDHLLHAR